MSSENVLSDLSETYGESLEDEQWPRIEQEEHLGEEFDKHRSSTDLNSYDSDANEEIDYSKEEALAVQIKRIEDLRSELLELKRRKIRAYTVLTDQIENGLCEVDIPIKLGTKKEIEQHYEKILMDFKNKKEAAVQQRHDFNKEKMIKSEYLETKRKECTVLAENQHNLELKTGVGMIYDKTNLKLTLEDIIQLLEPCKLQNIRLNKIRLEYVVQKNKTKKLRNNLEKLIPSTFNLTDFQKLTRKNKQLERKIATLSQTKIITQSYIKIELAKAPKIDKKHLNKEKEKKESELKQIKAEWKQSVEAKARNQEDKNRLKKSHKQDYFTENPLLLKDYYESIEKDRINKELVDDLRQELFEIEELKCKLIYALNIAEN